MRERRTLVLLISVWFFGLTPAAARQITTTDNPARNGSVTDFDCQQRVCVVVRWDSPPPAGHTLSVAWINPRGDVAQTTDVPVSGAATWAWIEFDDGAGSGFSRIVSPDKECDDFVGRWKARVLLDKKEIGTANFTVH